MNLKETKIRVINKKVMLSTRISYLNGTWLEDKILMIIINSITDITNRLGRSLRKCKSAVLYRQTEG